MTEQTLIQEIQTLPESLKLEVLHFVRYLKQKQEDDKAESAKSYKERKTESAKDVFEMTDDFKLLLKEFAEYKSSKSVSRIG